MWIKNLHMPRSGKHCGCDRNPARMLEQLDEERASTLLNGSARLSTPRQYKINPTPLEPCFSQTHLRLRAILIPTTCPPGLRFLLFF